MDEVSVPTPDHSENLAMNIALACPDCAKGSVRPQSVETANGCVIVTVKCEHCGRQWKVSKPDSKY
jgi:uncharacterized Zn finger protein